MRRPTLPRPWRWRSRRSGTHPDAVSSPIRPGAEEDLRLLRRTRLRLMGVSGIVMLFILVILGASVYWVVAAAIQGGAQAQLKSAAGIRESGIDDPYGFTVEGPRAGLIPVLVDPQGNVGVSPGLPRIPLGLPNAPGLAAVIKPDDIDMREITLADGTPYRVISFYSGSPRYANYKVQWAQNRTGEVNLLNTMGSVLLGGGLLALLAALLAGYLYAGRALVPIRESIERRQGALLRQREFAANASHELRSPLTVIGTSVEDLKRNRSSKVEDVGEALGDIEAEVRHMTALVEDMLLLARTDSGVVQIERVPLDLADVAAEAAGILSSVGQERGVRVLLDPLPTPVTGDPTRLGQLVTILVDNAIRHSPAGSTVAVLVRPEPGGALTQGGAVLHVDDQGPGIKPEDLSRIFERFWRADDAPAGGTGLGLAIARWIVDQHGGSIGAVNRPEGGASFWVRLPSVPVDTASPSDDPTAPAAAPDQWARPDSSAP
jgi:signal transduction histidine kinase